MSSEKQGCRTIRQAQARSKPLRCASVSPLCERVDPGSPLRCVRGDAECVARFCLCFWLAFVSGFPQVFSCRFCRRQLCRVTGTESPRTQREPGTTRLQRGAVDSSRVADTGLFAPHLAALFCEGLGPEVVLCGNTARRGLPPKTNGARPCPAPFVSHQI